MGSHAVAVKRTPQAIGRFEEPVRSTAMAGGMVGEMLKQIEDHMTGSGAGIASEPMVAARLDPLHIVSVAAGYVGLACGFGIAGIVISWIF